ncbi:hypothetical protein DVH26_22850 [Paenibacillus sp. H1-7]|nr:hypothetical protein DVH26_22850 [Paenibacillus sp. H1-7]
MTISPNLTYAPTFVSAVQYANAGMLEEWVQCYLLFTPKDAPVSYDFMQGEAIYFGVVKFPLRLIQSEGMKLVEAQVEEPNEPAALPPLIIEYEKGKFYSYLQKELFAALKQSKINAFPAVIVLKGTTDYKLFMKHFGTVLFFVDN